MFLNVWNLFLKISEYMIFFEVTNDIPVFDF